MECGRGGSFIYYVGMVTVTVYGYDRTLYGDRTVRTYRIRIRNTKSQAVDGTVRVVLRPSDGVYGL